MLDLNNAFFKTWTYFLYSGRIHHAMWKRKRGESERSIVSALQGHLTLRTQHKELVV
jgi:hypothetical protein